MSDEPEQPEESSNSPREIENYIFNLVVTLVQELSAVHPPKAAREYVASYLDRLSTELQNYEAETQGAQQ